MDTVPFKSHTNGKLTYCLRSIGAPPPDGTLNNTARIKNNHLNHIYVERPVLPVAVNTSVRINEEFLLLYVLNSNREASALSGEYPEESDQLCFLRSDCLTNLKGLSGMSWLSGN